MNCNQIRDAERDEAEGRQEDGETKPTVRLAHVERRVENTTVRGIWFREIVSVWFRSAELVSGTSSGWNGNYEFRRSVISRMELLASD